jgi:hypothetical protein
LGHLRGTEPPEFTTNFLGRPRAALFEHDVKFKISLTDFRFCRSDHRTPRLKLLADIRTRIQTVPAILAVGLTRAYQKSPAHPVGHWLQLNNIHLQDDPLGESLQPAPDDDELWLPPRSMAAQAVSGR